ncbi:HTH-type transcriptional regulator EthR [Mycobacterium xenopi 4042]|uniref:HTH-type transcriptional regulator EthR n=1 Tax=Mycobacterium xenopi 4042 TaxID=1299334 RepID=X8CL31_MYCXE|nr:HTH-type transcriptional regulator EthR [Mycobacterium xenopi 3993]EUA56769.1 HTH-type transcriptional regulator EthR [Mycobacterium xenopi 4042]
MTTLSPVRASHSRRSARPSGDDRELAILATAERLLEERSLAEISVDDLAKGAGLSRPTFYFYFPSKDAVLLTLFERVIVEADSALESMVANPQRTQRPCGAPASTFSSKRSARTARCPSPPTPPAPTKMSASSGRASCKSGSPTPPR